MRPLSLLLAALVLCSCETVSTHGKKPVILVDVSSQKIFLAEGKQIPCSTARRGTGGRPNSYRTPLSGNLYIGERYYGRFGPSLLVCGVSRDGYEQRPRRVAFHAARKSRMSRPTSLGCITVQAHHAAWLHATVPVGTPVIIRE